VKVHKFHKGHKGEQKHRTYNTFYPTSKSCLFSYYYDDANNNTIQNHFGKHTNSQSFLTCLFQLNPFLSCIMKENLLGLPQLLYGTMVI
jgi:hypothetical protein